MSPKKDLTPAAAFQQGEKSYDKDEYEDAIDLFSQCLQKGKKSAKTTKKADGPCIEDIYNNIGICYYQMLKDHLTSGQTTVVASKVKELFTLAEQNFNLALEANKKRLGLKKWEKGRNMCSLLYLARCNQLIEGEEKELCSSDKFKKTLEITKEIASYEDTVFPRDVLRLGSSGNMRDLEDIYFSNTVSRCDFWVTYGVVMIDVHTKREEFSKAISEYELRCKEAVFIYPDAPNQIVECIKKTKGETEAWKFLARSPSFYSRGLAEYYLDNFKDAILNLRAIQKGRKKEDDPETIEYYRANKLLTLCHINLEEYEKALKIYDKRSEKVDDAMNEDLYWNLGDVYHSEFEDYETAERYFDMSFSCTDGSYSQYSVSELLTVIDVKVKNKKKQEAINILTTVIGSRSDKKELIELNDALIPLLMETNRCSEAILCCQQILKLKPSCSKTKKLLKNLEKDNNRTAPTQPPKQMTPSQSATVVIQHRNESEESDEIDLVFYVLDSKKQLSQPFRYSYIVDEATTFADIRANVADSMDQNKLNFDEYRISPRPIKPLFWPEGKKALEAIKVLPVNTTLQAREIYLIPKSKYQVE